MLSDPSYSQRTVMCSHIAQCLGNTDKFPEGRNAVFDRGAEYLDGMIAADQYMRGTIPTRSGLRDYVFLGETMPLPERIEVIAKFPEWRDALRTKSISAHVGDEMGRFFSGRAAAYGTAMQYAATERAIREDE